MSFAGSLEEVRSRLHDDFLLEGVPSLSVAVSRNGKLVWEDAFGWANRETRKRATPGTMYSLASTTKPFTATCIMALVERGKIDLKKPVNDFLPLDSQLQVWIGNSSEVTVGRLVSHTSGLPRFEQFFHANTGSRRPAMELSIRRYGNVVTPPGERYRYSNLGYGILDYLVERQSGVGFGDFLQKEVFLPLGMHHSSLDIGLGLESHAAERYGEDGKPIPFYDTSHRGASSIYSSMRDLLLFGEFHLGLGELRVLSPAAIAEMRKPVADRNNMVPPHFQWPPKSGYGLGWVIADTPWGPLLSSAGGMAGASAQLTILPSQGIVMAVATNGFSQIPRSIDKYVLPAFIDDYPLDADYNKPSNGPVKPPDPTMPEYQALLGNWQGWVRTYEDDVPCTLSFQPSGDIHFKLGAQQQTTLVNNANLDGGWLTGKVAAYLKTSDILLAPRHPAHHVQLDLKVRDGRITGALVQIAGNALSHWVEVSKETNADKK